MDEAIVRQVLSYLIESGRKSFAYVNHYYFNCIYKADFRTITLSKENNLVCYLVCKEFRDHVDRLIRYPIKQLRFHSFAEQYQPASQVFQTVIDAAKDNSHNWERIALPLSSSSLREFTVTLPEARSLQFCSIITTDLIFVRFLQPALKKVTHLSISSDYSSSQRFLTEIFSFLEREGDSLDLHSLTLTGFSDSIYTLPYISTLKELVIKHSSIIFDSKYEDTNHEFNSIVCVDNKELREFKLSNVRSLKFQDVDVEDISKIHKMGDIFFSRCLKIKYFPVVFPPSDNMGFLGRHVFVDVTSTKILSLFCDGFDRFRLSSRPKNRKELRKLCITGPCTSLCEIEKFTFKQNSIVYFHRDYSGSYRNSNSLSINRFQLTSIVRIPTDEQIDDRRYVHIINPEGEKHLNSFKNRSNISVNILFKSFYGEK